MMPTRRAFTIALAAAGLRGDEKIVESAIGVTSAGEPIPSLVTRDDFDYGIRKTRILIVGGGDAAAQAVRTRQSAKTAVSAVPAIAHQGSWPPRGEYYRETGEGGYVWRWIAMHAPDRVIDCTGSGLAAALSATGIPAVAADAAGIRAHLAPGPVSPARREMQARLARTPAVVARQLASVYGHALPQVVYIPAVALIGRLRLGERADVEKIVEPYVSGAKDPLAQTTGSHFSGHLIFSELARLTGDRRYVDLVRAAADRAFDASGAPLEAMPLHNEMSDAVFMSCPILAAAGKLTGEAKYFDMCLRHLRFMLKLNLRPDGLHRHSPLDEAAWGRGNGFPALGLALALGDFPRTHPGHAEIRAALAAHLNALLPHQDPTGAWRQVIDKPGSYRELTATCMIAVAMLRAVRAGWLPRARFQPAIDRAWYAVRTRTLPDGSLVDVCAGTGKQRSLRAYYDRPAILGRDDRGGAMALLFSTELLER